MTIYNVNKKLTITDKISKRVILIIFYSKNDSPNEGTPLNSSIKLRN